MGSSSGIINIDYLNGADLGRLVKMNLTKQEAIENHRKMWNWIAYAIERRKSVVLKSDYFEENGIEGSLIPHNECFCCEYAYRDCGGGKTLNCEKCLFIWGTEDDKSSFFCEGKGSLYRDWKMASIRGYYDCAAYLAQQIAELSEREDVGNA